MLNEKVHKEVTGNVMHAYCTKCKLEFTYPIDKFGKEDPKCPLCQKQIK